MLTMAPSGYHRFGRIGMYVISICIMNILLLCSDRFIPLDSFSFRQLSSPFLANKAPFFDSGSDFERAP